MLLDWRFDVSRKNDVGRTIMEYREKHNLTLMELSAIVSLSPNNISRIEQGKATPSVKMLSKLRHILGLRGDDVTGDEYAVLLAWRNGDWARLLAMVSAKMFSERKYDDDVTDGK